MELTELAVLAGAIFGSVALSAAISMLRDAWGEVSVLKRRAMELQAAGTRQQAELEDSRAALMALEAADLQRRS